MAEKEDRRTVRSKGSTLEPDEIDSRQPSVGIGLDPMLVHHHVGQVPPNQGPSAASKRRGVTEVDGAARVAPHYRPPPDTGTAASEGSHGSRLYNELGNTETFGVREDRVGQERTSWNRAERSSCQPVPATAMPGRTQESATAPESSSSPSSFNPNSFLMDDLQDADLYGPPPGQSCTASNHYVPHFVMDHMLSSSSSSSSSSYHSTSSLPSGGIGGVFLPGAPMDSQQMEGVSVEHVATGIASIQLDDVEMDDTETVANQATENYAVTAETIRLANRLFQQDTEGDTILHLAIIEGVSESMILQLIQLFVRRDLLNLPNNRLQTPLHLATVTRRDDIVVRLLENDARRRVFDGNLDTPLHIACRQGDIGRVRTLHPAAAVDKKLEQELRVVAESANREGQSCLHVAAISNHLNVVRYLVEDCRVNINLKELRRGRTILHLAVEKKNVDLVRYLLNLSDSYELLVEDLTYDHYSALQMAQMTNQTQLVELLLLAGAQPIMDVDSR